MADPIPALNSKLYIRNAAGTIDHKFEDVNTITPFDGEATLIADPTLENATDKSYGATDYGTLTFTKRYSEADQDAMTELAALFEDQAGRLITWVLPGGSAIQFNARTPTDPIFPSEELNPGSMLRKAIKLGVTSRPTKIASFTPLTV